MLVVKRNMKSGLKVTISKIILADMGNYQFFVSGFQELLLGWGSSIKYVHKIFRKTNISLFCLMTVEIPKKILLLKYLFETESVFPQNFLQNVSRKFIAYDH